MEIKMTIKEINLQNKVPYSIKVQMYDSVQAVEDICIFKIKCFHDSLFGFVKILLRNFSLIPCVIGYTEIPLRILKTTNEKEFLIYAGKYEGDFHSYDDKKREVVGKMLVNFEIINESFDEHPINTQTSILDRIFQGVFNIENTNKLTLVLAKLLAFTSGNNISKLNAVKGLFYMLNYYSLQEQKFTFEEIEIFIKKLSEGSETSFSFLNETSFSFVEEPQNNFLLFEIPFYAKYKKYLLYAISSYGNSYVTNSLEKRLLNVKSEMKDYLENLPANITEIPVYNLNGSDHNPIFISFVDEDTFVISFRGTLSIRDVSFDLKFEYKELHDGYCHEGILELADSFIKNYFSQIKLILRKNKKKLILTGHSLGGSIAYIIGYKLLKNKEIEKDQLEVIAFSSAPVFSKNICEEEYFDGFVTFTYSNDSVPFLSYGAICDLRYLSVSLGARINLFKNDDSILPLVEEIQEYLIKNDVYPKLYIPGKIFQFKEYQDIKKGTLRKLFSFIKDNEKLRIYLCKENDYKFCGEFIMDINAVLYHFPYYMVKIFDSCILLNEEIANKNIESEIKVLREGS